MSCETISVRMNRSDTTIRWGFSLGQRGNEIVIATVDKDSLSEKAGLKPGDEVVSILDRHPLDLGDAQRSANSARLEITFNLKRFVTSHTCLPWTLTEKDNKLFVEEIPAGLSIQKTFSNTSSTNQWNRSGLPLTSGYTTESRSNYNYSSENRGSSYGERNIPIQHSPFSSSVNQTNYHSTETRNNYSNEPGRLFHSPSSYTTSMKNSGWNRERQAELSSGPARTDSYSNQSYSYSNTGPTSAGFGSNKFQGANNYNSSATGFGVSNGNAFNDNTGGVRPPQSYSYNGGVTSKPFGVGSGGTPLNQQTFINTSSPIPLGNQSSVSPGGTKIFYHSPSPRTRSQLSPNASVHHLQYNSPMNLYSSEACAEQFSQQTGLPVETPHNSKTPAYLTSATKKLIEEGEVFRRPTTPTQSSSFKRISQAVGEPVH